VHDPLQIWHNIGRSRGPIAICSEFRTCTGRVQVPHQCYTPFFLRSASLLRAQYIYIYEPLPPVGLQGDSPCLAYQIFHRVATGRSKIPRVDTGQLTRVNNERICGLTQEFWRQNTVINRGCWEFDWAALHTHAAAHRSSTKIEAVSLASRCSLSVFTWSPPLSPKDVRPTSSPSDAPSQVNTVPLTDGQSMEELHLECPPRRLQYSQVDDACAGPVRRIRITR
jgi:hypothetical protein